MPTLSELMMFAQMGPNIGPLGPDAIGILQDMKNVKLAKNAMLGDSAENRLSMAQLAEKSPRMAGTLLDYRGLDKRSAVDADAAQKEQQAKLQEMRGRIATGYANANDKGGFLQGMFQSLSQNEGDPIAAEMSQDMQEIMQVYAENPQQIDQFMNAEASRFGQVNANITPSRVRELELLTQGMSQEEKQKAIRTELGLDARAGMSAQERIAGDPNLTQAVAESQGLITGTKEDKKLDAQLSKKPRLEASIEEEKIKARNKAETEVNAPKAKARLAALTSNSERVIGTIDSALEKVSGMTSGAIGSVLSSVKGTPAYDLKTTALTIKANLGFDRLQEMRDNSPTGGALGQVAVQELDALQATIANLDLGQSPDQLIENLELVKEHYNNYMNAINASYAETYNQGGSSLNPDDAALFEKYGIPLDGN